MWAGPQDITGVRLLGCTPVLLRHLCLCWHTSCHLVERVLVSLLWRNEAILVSSFLPS